MASYMETEKSKYYLKLSGDTKARYDHKIRECGGIDPYTIKPNDLSTNSKDFPEITMFDIGDYMIHSVSPYTKRFLDNVKGTEAYRYFESGFVLNIGSKKNNISAIVVGKKSVTDVLCKWNVPSYKEVSMSSAKDITWRFPSHERTTNESSFLEFCDSFSHLSDETVDQFVLKYNSDGDDTAVETLYSSKKKRRTNIRDEIFLANLYSDNYQSKPLSELIAIGKSMLLEITKDEVNEISNITLPRLKSRCSLGLRRGRITGSNFRNCCVTNINEPSLTTIRRVINPIKNLDHVPTMRYQIRNKKRAIQQYNIMALSNHEDFVYNECGLTINSDLPYFVGSPDGLITCTCHGNGCIQVKCLDIQEPEAFDEFLTRKPSNILNKCGDKYFLERTHEYFYQVQLEMNLTNLQYCECVFCSPQKAFIVRAIADIEFWKVASKKAIMFHEQVIMPELLGKFYTNKIDLPNLNEENYEEHDYLYLNKENDDEEEELELIALEIELLETQKNN